MVTSEKILGDKSAEDFPSVWLEEEQKRRGFFLFSYGVESEKNKRPKKEEVEEHTLFGSERDGGFLVCVEFGCQKKKKDPSASKHRIAHFVDSDCELEFLTGEGKFRTIFVPLFFEAKVVRKPNLFRGKVREFVRFSGFLFVCLLVRCRLFSEELEADCIRSAVCAKTPRSERGIYRVWQKFG